MTRETPSQDQYAVRARELFEKRRGDNVTEPAVEFDPQPTISRGTAPGAWVAAWVWVPDQPKKEGVHVHTPQQGAA